MKTNFTVYYHKPVYNPFERDDVTINGLSKTHIELKTIEAHDIDHVFGLMQGEFWSPNGEARELIESKGLDHTSMSVNDVVYSERQNMFFICTNSGWKILK